MSDTYTVQVEYIRIPARGALAGLRLPSSVRFPNTITAKIWLSEAKGNPELSEFTLNKGLS